MDTPTPLRLRSDSIATQAKLVAVAERLFAEHGVDGVSLSEINRQAEQGNNSALHYHFGGSNVKAALLEAIAAKHTARIDPTARTRFVGATSLRDAIEDLLLPLSARVSDPDGGAAFLILAARGSFSWDGEVVPAPLVPAFRGLMADRAVYNLRVWTAIRTMWAEMGDIASRGPSPETNFMVAALGDVLEAILACPLSDIAKCRR